MWDPLVWDCAPGVRAVAPVPDAPVPLVFVLVASKGKVAYCGFDGGDGAIRDGSVRKDGGERPKAEGEKAFGRDRWFVSVCAPVGVDGRSVVPCPGKMDERDGDG